LIFLFICSDDHSSSLGIRWRCSTSIRRLVINYLLGPTVATCFALMTLIQVQQFTYSFKFGQDCRRGACGSDAALPAIDHLLCIQSGRPRQPNRCPLTKSSNLIRTHPQCLISSRIIHEPNIASNKLFHCQSVGRWFVVSCPDPRHICTSLIDIFV
jgi:hypothetical protein